MYNYLRLIIWCKSRWSTDHLKREKGENISSCQKATMNLLSKVNEVSDNVGK